MPSEPHRVSAVSLPSGAAITRAYATTDYADAYSVELPAGASTDPEVLARLLFERPSRLSRFLLNVRDALVGCWGLKTAGSALSAAGRDATRIGIFRVYGLSPTEILLGEDDKHLDFRVSVLCSLQQPPAGGRQVTLSTVIRYHNVFGRLYFFVIAPFHRLLVRSALRRAARMRWPSATEV